MKILLPVDGSDYTRRMLAYLAAHAELLPGDHEYTMFTVIEPFSPYDANFAKAVSMEDFMREQAEQVLGGWADLKVLGRYLHPTEDAKLAAVESVSREQSVRKPRPKPSARVHRAKRRTPVKSEGKRRKSAA